MGDHSENNDHTQFSQDGGSIFEGGQNLEYGIATLSSSNMGDIREVGTDGPMEKGEDRLNPQLQALLNTVMQAINSESAKLTSAIQSLKGELKADISQVVRDLTKKFDVPQNQVREELGNKLDSAIMGVSARIDEIAQKNENTTSKLSSAVDENQAKTDRKIDTQIAEVRKYVDNKVREIAEDGQISKKNAEELIKVGNQIRELRNNVDSFRPPTGHPTKSGNTGEVGEIVSRPSRVTPYDADTNQISTRSGVGGNEQTICSSMVDQTIPSGNPTNVNATFGMLNRGVELQELTLPTFSDSSKQAPLHFIRDLDLYFKLRQTPETLKIPLAFRAIQEPVAKQWFSGAYDKLNNYEAFKEGFTGLLWSASRQAGVRSKIYLDKHTPHSKESYVDHYIRYANLASTLDPPLQDADLLTALTPHYESRIQQGLLCGNFKCTQEVLGYLSKVQGLQEESNRNKPPRQDGARGEQGRQSHPGFRQEERTRDRGNQVHVRTVRRQADRPDPHYRNRQHYTTRGLSFDGRNGRNQESNNNRLNPDARQFNPYRSGPINSSDQNEQGPDDDGQPLN